MVDSFDRMCKDDHDMCVCVCVCIQLIGYLATKYNQLKYMYTK